MRSQAAFSHPRLVFLHIPKTAGTSIREIIKSVYGTDATLWYTREKTSILHRAKTNRYSRKQVEGKLFVGGHKPRSFYPPDEPNLYCTTVREPIDRVKSWFSYHTRPAAASSQRDFEIRQRLLRNWLAKGIDPDSIVNSIERCAPFRRIIQNQQCGYISRAGNSFDDALETIRSENFLIGSSNQVNTMIETLADLFDWPETPEIFGNKSRPGTNDDILSEVGAIELINQYCAEDLKLYQYICEENRGLYFNLPEKALVTGSKLNLGPLLEKEISRRAWKKVDIECPETLAHDGEKLPLIVHNRSREYLNPELGKGLFFVYRLIDHEGREISHECVRTRLTTIVAPGSSHSQDLQVKIPEDYARKTSAIKVGMLHAGKYWIDRVEPEHASMVPLTGRQADEQLQSDADITKQGGAIQ